MTPNELRDKVAAAIGIRDGDAFGKLFEEHGAEIDKDPLLVHAYLSERALNGLREIIYGLVSGMPQQCLEGLGMYEAAVTDGQLRELIMSEILKSANEAVARVNARH